MKICFVARSAYPIFNETCKATFGGAEVDLFIIASELAKDTKFKVNFLVGDFGQPDIEIRDGITLYKGYKFKEIKIVQIIKLVRRVLSINADIYLQEGASGGSGVIAFVCKLRGKKFIYRTASAIDCDGTFVRKHVLEGFLYRYALKNASRVITQNESNRDELRNNFGVYSIVIRNALKLPKPSEKSRNTVLWVARSEQLKQPFLFLELAKTFPQQKFVMICPTANFNSVDMVKLEADAKDIPNLEFVPYVSFSDIDQYFADAAIFVNTSRYEGFPNTFIQATSHGSVLLSLNVNPDNFLSDYECGLCAKGNSNFLKEYLGNLFADNSMLVRLSKNAQRYAQEKHNISRNIESYKKVFSELCNS
jgi:glycosyltransferase involved in cell wall biosynthesis